MIYTPLINHTIQLAFKAHEGQKDKTGNPYITHPLHLAEQMDTEEEIIVALLHDVVEDTEITFEDLEKLGYSDTVLEALRLLTHNSSVPYLEYVAAIKENELARKVKLQDLRHNSDTSRLLEITDKDLERLEKYKKAIEILEENGNKS